MSTRIALLSLAWLAIGFCSEHACAQADERNPRPNKQAREEIDKLIAQLKSDTFKVREEAMRQLMERDDALSALREAAKLDDAEVVRRAQQAIAAINKRLSKRAIRRAIALLKKGQTDQFVEQVMPWRDYVDEECWKAVVEHAKTIADEASKVGGRKFKLTWAFDLANLQFVPCAHRQTLSDYPLIKNERIIAESVTSGGFIYDSFIICDGPVKLKGPLAGCVIFASGNVKVSAAQLVNCVVVCDGDVTVAAAVGDSVLIATGSVSVGAYVADSVIMSGGGVKLGLKFPGSSAKNSVIQEHQRGPLNLIHFFDLAQAGIEVKATKDGVRVEALAATRSFARAGVRQGDQVVAVGGVKIDSAETFRRLLRRHMQESNPVMLEIRQEGRPVQVEVHLSGGRP